FQTMRRVWLPGIPGKPRLTAMAQGQVDAYRTSIADVSGQPVYFSVLGTEMELLPTPNQEYDIGILYRANIPALSDANTANWLLTMAPDVYLYGALLEASPYLENDSRVALWGTAFRDSIDALNR